MGQDVGLVARARSTSSLCTKSSSVFLAGYHGSRSNLSQVVEVVNGCMVLLKIY